MKKCPFCAEEIKAEAIKCKHCGEFLDRRPKNYAVLKPANYEEPPTVYCSNCGYTGLPKGVKDGSGAIEVVLWLCYLVPGLIYTLWRSGTVHYICPKCGSKEIVESSTREKAVVKPLQPTPQLTEKERKEWQRKVWKDGLIIIGVIAGAFVLLFIGLVLTGKTGSNYRPPFPWLKTCNEKCAKTLGIDSLAWIGTRSCLELMLYFDSNYNHTGQERLAARDRMVAVGCVNARPGPYQPLYSWQKKCDEKCAKAIELEKLQSINTYDCASIQEWLPYARNPKEWGDYEDEWEYYDAWSKAILDKAQFLQCN